MPALAYSARSPRFRPSSRAALLQSASFAALVVAAAAPAAWAGGPPSAFSPAWFAARSGTRTGGGTAYTPSLAALQQTVTDISRAGQAATRMRAFQAQARAAALTSQAFVPNGLTRGGLVPASGAAAFLGAQLPTQSTSGGQTNVSVQQTSSLAILNWRSFNVGAHTSLTFNQSAGGAAANTWVALNKVSAKASPSLIEGQINAPGQILILNPNGVLFSGSAQVNVGALLASSGHFTGGDQQFLSTGLYSTATTDSTGATVYVPTFSGAQSPVTVAAGAEITTTQPDTPLSGGGYVVLLGSNVSNAGHIVTGQGQTALAAGRDFTMLQGYTVNPASTVDSASTVIGFEIATDAHGTVGNSGLIEAATGDISLVGHAVVQSGVALATTSVNRRGTVHLLTTLTESLIPSANPTITLSPGSVTMILPDSNSATAFDAQRAAAVASSASANAVRASGSLTLLNDDSLLADAQYESRVEISTAGSVTFGSGSLTVVPSGQIAVYAGQRVVTETGAALDVGGVLASLPMSANSYLIEHLAPFNLRDAPNNRDTGLIANANLPIDINALLTLGPSVGDTSTREYTQGGLLEVSGLLGNIGHTINEWSTPGGTITLATSQLLARPGSEFNLSGGAISYSGGNLPQAYLIGSDGRLYNVNTAPASLTYVGVYGGDTVEHPHWNVTNVYRNPLIAPAELYEAGYVVGRDAGSLIISAASTADPVISVAFSGSIDAGVVHGQRQTVTPTGSITDPYQQPQNTVPLNGTLALGNYAVPGETVDLLAAGVTIENTIDPRLLSLGDTTAWPKALLNNPEFSAASLNAADLGGLSITVADTLNTAIAVDAALTLADAAQVTLTARRVAINDTIVARSGAITTGVTAAGSVDFAGTVTLAGGATLDTRGVWTNQFLSFASDPSGLAAVNGGAVTLDALSTLTVAAGSLIDVSSGGAILASGKMVGGTGGNVTLAGNDGFSTGLYREAKVTLAGAIRGYGSAGAGSLVLRVPGVVVGKGAKLASPLDLAFAPGFFQSGFATYDIDASVPLYSHGTLLPGVQVLPGTTVDVAAPVELATPVSYSVPTGADPATAMPVSLPPEYFLNPAKATVTQRLGASLALRATVPSSATPEGSAISVGAGAVLRVDTGQSVRLESVGQLTVNGTIEAPGGTIALTDDRGQEGGGPLTVATDYKRGESVWVGSGALLSVAGLAVTGQDAFGQTFGTVLPAGTIDIGTTLGTSVLNTQANVYASTTALLLVRPGATLDLSGASATLAPLAGRNPLVARLSGLTDAAVDAPALVAGNGGTLSLSSYSGIDIEGTVRAGAGGPGAAGGTLQVLLEAPILTLTSGITTVQIPFPELRDPHEIIIGQGTPPSQVPANLRPGGARVVDTGAFATARFGADEISADGFGALSFTTHDLLLFDGSVTLRAAQSIKFNIGEFADTKPTGSVLVSAPYLLIQGIAPENLSALATEPGSYTGSELVYEGDTPTSNQAFTYGSQFSHIYPPCFSGAARCESDTLSFEANLIDVVGQVGFGINSTIDLTNDYYGETPAFKSRLIDYPGFSEVTLDSQGDIRIRSEFAGTTTQIGGALVSDGNITLAAAQVYAVDTGTIAAGVEYVVNQGTGTFAECPASFAACGTLTIARSGGNSPPPDDIGGLLQLSAATIEQGGMLRQPYGDIVLGTATVTVANSAFQGVAGDTRLIQLLPGSLTSTSLAGQTVPYGGTTNGEVYDVNGVAISAGANPIFNGGSVSIGAGPNPLGITLEGRSVRVAAGATIDLSGGGDLSGGAGEYFVVQSSSVSSTLSSQGFISGRGGSTDTLVTPLVTFSGGTINAPSLQQNGTGSVPVFAIVPGQQPYSAPVTPFDSASTTDVYYGSLPGAGEQITIAAGTSGLPAGTYTLYPSYYALLPGAYRVEIDGANSATQIGATALQNGSIRVPGYLGVNGTGVRSGLPLSVVLTSGSVVRRYSDYDEESYSQYKETQAALFNNVRPYLPEDPQTLTLDFVVPPAGSRQTALQFDGTALFDAPAGAYSGATVVQAIAENSNSISASGSTTYPDLEITGPGGRTTSRGKPFDGVSVEASQLDAIGSPVLDLSLPQSLLIHSVTIRSGAVLEDAAILATESLLANSIVVVNASGTTNVSVSGSLDVEAGATLSTIGRGPVLLQPGTNGVFTPFNGIILADTSITALATLDANNNVSDVGIGTACATDVCASGRPAALLSAGSMILSSAGQLTLDPRVVYGASNLQIAVPVINIGAVPASAPTGLTLSQPVLNSLIAGSAAPGVPPLQSLTLVANQSVNFYGGGGISTVNPATGQSSLAVLEIDTPAIYGKGSTGDVATITTGTLYWNNIVQQLSATFPGDVQAAPPGPIGPDGAGTGAGTLDIKADQIIFGYSPGEQVTQDVPISRTIYGFSTVDITGASLIEANNQGSLSVHQNRGTYTVAGTYASTGGTLNLITPELTGAAGSIFAYTAGGAINVSAPAGAAPSGTTDGALGAEIDMTAASITDSSAIVLPSGKLTMTALTGDVDLSAGSRVVLPGESRTFFDYTANTWGGAVSLESRTGNVIEAAGATIDLSATGNAAGSLSVTATAGTVSLAGAIAGALLGTQGATTDTAGSIDIRARTLVDFTGLNERLNDGGVFGARTFDLGTGSLSIGNDPRGGALVRARDVDISVDSGSLTITGTVDASGPAPGVIRLSSSGDLTIASGAVLDAHGTVPQLDYYGQSIDAENTGSVELSVGAGTNNGGGTLILAAGSTINVSAAPGIVCALGPCGRVELDAPRLGSASSGDIAIAAGGSIDVLGAGSIDVNAFWSYVPKSGAIVQTTGTEAQINPTSGTIDLTYANSQSRAFIGNAEANGHLSATLQGKLAGLTSYVDAFHLRPGVLIQSAGALTVKGDLDLSAFRYGSVNPNTQQTGIYDSGEPGDLIIRAGGNLNIYGSINDGFGQKSPFKTPDDNGWVLLSLDPSDQNGEITKSNVVVPLGVTLSAATVFPSENVTLTYSLPVASGNTIAVGAILPVAVTLDSAITTSTSFRLQGTIIGPNKNVLYREGQIVPVNATIPAGSTFEAGTLVTGAWSSPVTITAMTWPAGASLAAFFGQSITQSNETAEGISLSGPVNVPAGGTIPVNTAVFLTDSGGTQVEYVDLRTNGLGTVFGAEPMLPAGDLSWSMRLVAGADTAAADTRALASATSLAAAAGAGINTAAAADAGNLILSDLHWSSFNISSDTGTQQLSPTQSFSVVRTGTGELDLLAGGSLQQGSLYGIYTAGTQSPDVAAEDEQPRTGFVEPGGSVVETGKPLGSYGTITSGGTVTYAAVANQYQAYYPQGGGDLLIAAQGDIRSVVQTSTYDNAQPYFAGAAPDSDAIGGWLWRQGGGGVAGAWWINFGSYAVYSGAGLTQTSTSIALTGFQGMGSLGGGNVTVSAGGNAGVSANDYYFATSAPGFPQSSALDIVVASTGRASGSGVQRTGGGQLTVAIGGALNELPQESPAGSPLVNDDLSGLIANLRGPVTVMAGSVGSGIGIPSEQNDPRGRLALAPADLFSGLPPDLALGDASATIDTRGDLAISAVADPTRVESMEWESAISNLGGSLTSSGSVTESWFSLWTPNTSGVLVSAGGNLEPTAQPISTPVSALEDTNGATTDYRPVVPATLTAVAASGNLVVNEVELAPSSRGNLTLIAANSVYGQASTNSTFYSSAYPSVDLSGADPSNLPNPQNPADIVYGPAITTNNNPNAHDFNLVGSNLFFPLFAFEPDTALPDLHANDPTPARIYAATGDIVDVNTGEELTNVGIANSALFTPSTWYIAAKPVQMVAGQDIVISGTPLAGNAALPGASNGTTVEFGATSIGDLFLNDTASGVSLVEAGRDIFYLNAKIAGPGQFVADAGRNFYQADAGVLESIGVLNRISTQSSGGAGITAMAGTGSGLDYANFANLYFNPANLANTTTPLQNQPGKVDTTYQDQLLAYMQTTYGYTGAASDVLAAFLALSPVQQSQFVLQVFFDELNASGLEHNDPTSRFYQSYLVGENAIKALLPPANSTSGDMTLFGGSGIRTDYGGAITTVVPGGQTVLGLEGGTAPPSTAGILTQGEGDIDMYSQGSVVLGQSRVLTTFGGNLLMWSEQGDINAGRGSKSTVLFAPASISYNNYGFVTLSPTAPSTGAGIGTIAPIPSVPAGNVNLVAPNGTIDVGEAGVRSSGNANLAALLIVNAANIAAAGKVTGVPVVVAPNVAAITAASNAASSAQNAAQNSDVFKRRRKLPSQITVEVLGFGG